MGNWTYKSTRIRAVNAEQRNGRLRRRTARCSGSGIAPCCGDAGGNWGAWSTCSESGAEGPAGVHFGEPMGDGERMAGSLQWLRVRG